MQERLSSLEYRRGCDGGAILGGLDSLPPPTVGVRSGSDLNLKSGDFSRA